MQAHLVAAAAASGIRWTYHGTIIVHSYAAIVAWLNRMCGCVPLEYGEDGAPVWRNGGCCVVGDNLIEVVEPNDPDGPPGRFIARFGPGMYNLAFQVEDLAATYAWLARKQATPTFPPERRFTFTRPSETLGLQFQWADLVHDWDPRFGGIVPPNSVTPVIPVPRIAFWGALVPDPQVAAERLADLLALDLLFLRADAPLDQPAAAFSVNDGVLVLYRLPTDVEEEARLWGTRIGRARFHLMGLRVHDLRAAEDVLRQEGIGILDRAVSNGCLNSHPRDTLGIGLAWTDRDIEGDPRGALRR